MPREVGRTTLHRGSRVSFELLDFEWPGGRRHQHEVVRHPGAVCVLPVHDGGREVTLIRVYRVSMASMVWEVVAGGLEPGESPEVCAPRELAEEAGLHGGELVPLGRFLTTPGVTDEWMHVYAAVDPVPGERDLQPAEMIEVHRLGIDEAWRMVDDGEIVDGKCLMTLMLAHRKGLIESGAR